MMQCGRCFEFKYNGKVYDVECEYTETLTSYYPRTFYEPEEFETDINMTLLVVYDKGDYERFVCDRELFKAIEQYIYSLPVDSNGLLRERAEGIAESKSD